MCSLILETAMVARYAGSSNHAGNAMGVFFTFCFISFYGGGCDTTSYVYCSTSPLRTKSHLHTRKTNLITYPQVKSSPPTSAPKAWPGPSSAPSCPPSSTSKQPPPPSPAFSGNTTSFSLSLPPSTSSFYISGVPRYMSSNIQYLNNGRKQLTLQKPTDQRSLPRRNQRQIRRRSRRALRRRNRETAR